MEKVLGSRPQVIAKGQVMAERKLRVSMSDLGGSGGGTQSRDWGQALGSCCWNESLSLCLGEQKGLWEGSSYSKAGLLEKHLPGCLRTPCVSVPFLPRSYPSTTLLTSCWNPLGLQPSAHLAPSSLRPQEICEYHHVPREKGEKAECSSGCHLLNESRAGRISQVKRKAAGVRNRGTL